MRCPWISTFSARVAADIVLWPVARRGQLRAEGLDFFRHGAVFVLQAVEALHDGSHVGRCLGDQAGQTAGTGDQAGCRHEKAAASGSGQSPISYRS